MTTRRIAIVLLGLIASTDLGAQTSGRRRPQTRPSSSSSSVRSELAAVLLESGKYSDAAREYRQLLRTNNSPTYRLGLVRALTWGGSYREAERELTILKQQRPVDQDVEQLQQLVRTNLEPGSREARQWVFERPYYPPYRIALAKALVRERQPRAAIAQYDTLLASVPTPAVLRGLGEAYSAANDRPAGIARLRAFVAAAPADTGYRMALVDLLVADRQFDAAIAQTDTVLFFGRTPAVLLARAQIDIAHDNLAGAERDLNEALTLKQTPEAYLLLGDTYRWRGQFNRARQSYEYARIMKHDRTVTAAFAQLARDQRSVLAFEPAPAAEDGWQSNATVDGDNGGVHYSTVDFKRGFEFGNGFVGSTSLEMRQLRENNATSHGEAGGYAADVGVAREGIAGAFYGRMGATAGLVFHPLAKTVPAASMSFTGRYYAWSGSFEFLTAPAYPSLRTLASLIPSGEGSRPLTEVTTGISLAGPIGVADIAVGMRHANISDHNSRKELQAYARLPLNPALSAVYWGSTIDYAIPSAQYWSPQGYSSNSLGLELAARQLRGWSLVARLLPGVASTTDLPFTQSAVADTSARKLRFQVSTGGELAYRRPSWEMGVGFDWGRVANYSRSSLSAHLTLGR
jgi:tetratricopeptide (TPR) repeat protein